LDGALQMQDLLESTFLKEKQNDSLVFPSYPRKAWEREDGLSKARSATANSAKKKCEKCVIA